MKSLIIGDVAGQFDALMRMVDKYHRGRRIILLGDLPDRGPDSRKVLDWAWMMTKEPDGDTVALKGNHEDLMVDACLSQGRYDRGVWFENGGLQTIQNYGYEGPEYWFNLEDAEAACKLVPREQLEWLDQLPIFYQEPGLFASHAPWDRVLPLGAAHEDRRPEMSPLWNRSYPAKREGVFQVFGHNSSWGLQRCEDWGICLDDTRRRKLTGLLWPENEVVQEDYEEKK